MEVKKALALFGNIYGNYKYKVIYLHIKFKSSKIITLHYYLNSLFSSTLALHERINSNIELLTYGLSVW